MATGEACCAHAPVGSVRQTTLVKVYSKTVAIEHVFVLRMWRSMPDAVSKTDWRWSVREQRFTGGISATIKCMQTDCLLPSVSLPWEQHFCARAKAGASASSLGSCDVPTCVQCGFGIV